MDILIIHYRDYFKKYILENISKFPQATVIVCTHLKEIPGTKTIRCKKDDSIGHKRNLLLEASTKRIKVFMDEDDIQMKYRITAQYLFMKKNNLTICSPKTALVFDTETHKCWKGPGKCIEGCLMFIGEPKAKFADRNNQEGLPFVDEPGFGYFDEKIELYILLKHSKNTIEKIEPKGAKIDEKVKEIYFRVIRND